VQLIHIFCQIHTNSTKLYNGLLLYPVTEIFRFNEYTIQSGTLRCRKVEEESIPLLLAEAVWKEVTW